MRTKQEISLFLAVSIEALSASSFALLSRISEIRFGLYGYPRGEVQNEVVTSYSLLTAGVVAGIQHDLSLGPVVLAALQSNPGNSGGPLFNPDSGEVVGLHKGQLLTPSEQDIIGYSINVPILTLVPVLEKFGILPE